MGEETKIEWCDHSWSPWRGCTKVSPGCAHCYAETLSKRNPAVLGQWGKGKPRVLAKNWNEPVQWQREHEKTIMSPYDKHPTVFPSLCDWLDDEVPVEWLAKFLQLIRDTPNLTWLLLTKRPENFMRQVDRQALCRLETMKDPQQASLREWLGQWINGQPPANVWVGTSVEDQTRANERIPALLSIPAAGRFLSVEPLLGKVRLDCYECGTTESEGGITLFGNALNGFEATSGYSGVTGPKVDWVIIGGESGHGARPCNVEWIQSLVRQCKDASIPCFVKQLGYVAIEHQSDEQGNPLCNLQLGLTHPKGGDPAEWSENLRVREFPEGLR